MVTLSILDCQIQQLADTICVTQGTKDWLDLKFREWRNGQKRGEDTVARFANFVGVSRNTMNNWLNRGQTPGDESADLIATKLGPEIYDLLGLPRPDPLLQLVIERWGQLSDEVRSEIAEVVQRAEARGATGQGGARVEVPERGRKTGH
jgi:hypothetical protein